jgi:hypothetical protein
MSSIPFPMVAEGSHLGNVGSDPHPLGEDGTGEGFVKIAQNCLTFSPRTGFVRLGG